MPDNEAVSSLTERNLNYGPGVTAAGDLVQPWASPPSVSDVERITALTDPVVRNLQITQCYHELSLALGTRTGSQANWCTFAVWASKQAGQTIRKQDLARVLEQLWETSSEVSMVTSSPTSLRPPVVTSASTARSRGSRRAAARSAIEALSHGGPLHNFTDYRRRIRNAVMTASSFERASEATARGNRKVFAEIAREFARFLPVFETDTVFDAGKISVFCAAFRPGEPPDGQGRLVQAFTSYYQALFETDPKARAELLLFANVAVGLHEQTRLQPEITDALNAPVIDPGELRRRLLEIFLPDLGWPSRLRLRLMSRIGLRNPVDIACSRLVEQARLLGRMVVTEHLLRLSLPGGERLDAGKDLRAEFPTALAHLVNTELLALLDLVDPTPDSLQETAAADWSVLPDRMHFIVDMFRCFQERPELLSPPFTPEQVATLKDGRRPEGRL
jgi:hypothetical protein